MPCKICHSSFNLFNWKLKCGECSANYCKKCLKNQDGVMFCEKCTVLIKRPPDRNRLMELKPKDLQEYLQKHNIPTLGLVEKSELVDLLCDKPIPVRQRKGAEKLMANFPGSVPNLSSSTFTEFIDQHQSGAGANKRARAEPNVRTHFRPPYAHQQTSQQFSSGSTSPPHRPQPTQFQPQAPPRQRTNTNSSVPQSAPSSPSAPPPENDRSNRTQNQPTTSTTNVTIEDTMNTPKDSPKSSPLPPKYPKLSDYESAEELVSLSAKQLKTLLTLNRVDYKGCVEKSELLERAQRLWQDSNKYKNEELPEEVEELCKLCMDAPLDCVLLECGHIATCIDCGKKLAECPICRQYVARVVRTFKA